ncbi:MAG: hypothetical protein IPP83_12825 [Flavobacteriales bacterium]|nr:hypothetical protein [Flavobacteriales bacterium]
MVLFVTLALLLSTGQGQQIVRAEYFIDTDLGPGLNTALPITPGDTVLFSTTLPLAGLSLGYHFLFVRTKDDQGMWSMTAKKRLYIYDDVPPPPVQVAAQLVSFEYHIVNDAGPGNGIQVLLTPNNSVFVGDTVLVTDTISVLGFEERLLPIYGRVRDSNGVLSPIAGDTTYRGVGLELSAQVRPWTRPDSQERFAVEVKNEGGVTGYGALVLLDMPNSSPARMEEPVNSISGLSADSVPLLLEYYGRHFGLVFIDSLPPETSTSFVIRDQTPNTFPHNLHHFRFALLPPFGEYATNNSDVAISDLHSLLSEAYWTLRNQDSALFAITANDFDSLSAMWLTINRQGLDRSPISLIVRSLFSDLLSLADAPTMHWVDSAVVMSLDRRDMLFADTLGEVNGFRDINTRPTPPCGCKLYCVERNEDACNCVEIPCLTNAPIDNSNNYHLTSDYCEPRCYNCNRDPQSRMNRHNALDISRINPSSDPNWVGNSTDIKAVCSGIVTFSGRTADDCGNSVVIECTGCNKIITYCHLTGPLHGLGNIGAGDVVGKVGCSGVCDDEIGCVCEGKQRRHIHIRIGLKRAEECLLNPWQLESSDQVGMECKKCKQEKQTKCDGQDEVHDGDPNAKYGLFGYGPLHWVAIDETVR